MKKITAFLYMSLSAACYVGTIGYLVMCGAYAFAAMTGILFVVHALAFAGVIKEIPRFSWFNELPAKKEDESKEGR